MRENWINQARENAETASCIFFILDSNAFRFLNGATRFCPRSEGLLGPAVLLHDALFLLGREVVLDVEVLADFGDALALDLRSDLGARELEQGLNVEVVGSHNDLEELLSLDVHVVSVPGLNDLGEVRGAQRLLDLGWRVLGHALHEHEHLLHHGLVELVNEENFIGAPVLDLDSNKPGGRGDVDWNLKDFTILALESAGHLL